MKKVSLIIPTTGIALILIGLIWSGFSWHRIQSNFENINRKNYTSKQATFDSSSVQNIKVNIGNVKVIVKTQADASHIKLTYSQSKFDKYKVADMNGTVSIVSVSSPITNNFCLFECMGSPNPITIYVPASSDYAYNLTAANASVAFNNTATLHTKTVYVSSSNSRVSLQGIAANGTMSLTSSNGSIRVQNVTATGKLSLGSSNANNTLMHVQAPNITSKTSNGSATLNAVTTKDLTTNTSNANITLDRLIANHINLTSSNGGIRGTIVGPKADYNIELTSDNGSLKVNGTKYNGSYFSNSSSASAKSLTAKSSNSTVNITFVQ